jgi:hypothetical protein
LRSFAFIRGLINKQEQLLMEKDLEEIVNDNIDEIGVDAVIERQRETSRNTPRWESWVALTSSLLAVLSAVTALYATFAADKAAVAESQETVDAAYAAGAEATYHILRTKIGILAAFEKPVDPADEAAATTHAILIEEYREKDRESGQIGGYEYHTHDQLTIAVALFQVSILLGGLAVVVQRPALWMFGMSFTAVGVWFMGNGLLEYFT